MVARRIYTAVKDTVQNAAAARRPWKRNHQANAEYRFKLHPESLRFLAYSFFWIMCIIAILLTKYIIRPILLKGPTDGKSCPPFEMGEGFDINTDSHLRRVSGYNNVSIHSFLL